jgi:hypothetical protein
MSFFNRVWTRVCSVVNHPVTHWSVWMGQGDGENTKVSVHLEENAWYWYLLEFLAWDCTTSVCDVLHHIPLPKFICNWERNWGGDPEDGNCTLEQWYGDSIGSFWCCFVEHPACQWVWKHKKPYSVIIDMTLAEARKKFEHYPHQISWIDEELESRRKYDEEEASKINSDV